MKLKKIINKILILTALIVPLSLSSCAKYKQIRPTSIAIAEIKPHSFRNFGIKLDVGVRNPAPQVKFTETLGVIFYKGEEIGTVTAEPFIFEGRKESVCPIQFNLNLNSGFHLVKLMRALQDSAEMDNLSLNLSTKVRLKSGLSKRLKYNDVPAAFIFERMKPLLQSKMQSFDLFSTLGF